MKNKPIIGLFVLLNWIFLPVYGQTIVQFHDPNYLVHDLFIKPDGGIKVTKVQYRGFPKSIGAFYSNATNLPIPKGIILTTGMAPMADGPNQSGSTSGELGSIGDSVLSQLSGCKTYDAAVLKIDFVATYPKIEFKYFFASEEYPEYVNKGVNDVFAFLIEGPGFEKPLNLATLPGTDKPVTVDNINHIKNSHLFIKNDQRFSSSTGNFNVVSESEMGFAFQFDGLTTLLTATTNVVPGETYRITLAIADAGDAAYDSGVFIKARSFKSFNPATEPVPDSTFITLSQMPGVSLNADDLETSDTLSLFTPVYFAHDAIDPDQDSHQYLKKVAEILMQNSKLSLHIVGHTDATGNNSYNQRLSERRAASVKDILVKQGANAEAITTQGKGKFEPTVKGTSTTDYAKNRRVEFIFILHPN